MKRPSFQFYPGDWLRATDLRACSIGARGLWIDMLCLMHEGTPYGHLKVGEKVILPSNLARIVGATLPEVEGWLSELGEAAVFSRDESGCIFSRRMIKDEIVRQSRASGGKLGGNPLLKASGKVGNKVNLTPNLQPTPSSASASASAVENKADGAHPQGVSPFQHVYDFGCNLFPQLAAQNTSSIHQWINSGANIELDIIPELRRFHGKGVKPRGWGLFTQDIADAKTRRESPLPRSEPKHGRAAARHSGFSKQDYLAGTEGFEVIGGSNVSA